MRSGIVYGTAGMLDGVIDRIREVLPQGEHPHHRGHRQQRPGDRALLPQQGAL